MMNKKGCSSSYLKGLLLVGLLMAGVPALAQNAVYRWTGDDGVIHYGAMPPLGVEAELVKAGGPNVGGDSTDTAAVSGDSDTAAEGDNAPPAVELSPEMKARKEAACKEEQQRLATLQKPGRIRMQQPDGSTKYLSVEDVQAEINITQQVIKDTCN